MVTSPGWSICTSVLEQAASFVTRHHAFHSPHVYICLSHFHGRYLAGNEISGTIPSTIGPLTGLTELYVFRASRILRHTASCFPLTTHIYIHISRTFTAGTWPSTRSSGRSQPRLVPSPGWKSCTTSFFERAAHPCHRSSRFLLTSHIHMALALSRQAVGRKRDQRDDPNRDWLPHRAEVAVRLFSSEPRILRHTPSRFTTHLTYTYVSRTFTAGN